MVVSVRVPMSGRGTGGMRLAGRASPERFGRIPTLVSQDWPAVGGQFWVLLFDLLPLLQRVLPVQDGLPVAAVRLLP